MTQPDSNLVLYTRNGFTGPMATLAREQYSTDYTRVEGDYAPRISNLNELDPALFADRRALPIAILTDPDLTVEVAYRAQASPFALRNVRADELHVFFGGAATLETEFGVLSVAKDDIVLIPRATSYRIVDIQSEVREFILVARNELSFAMQPGLGPLRKLDYPTPYADPSVHVGEYETVMRHNGGVTSVFTDYDPLPTAAAEGTKLVVKASIHDIRSINIGSGLLVPPLIVDDPTTHTLTYDMSARTGDRPPIHYNADYDEIFLYLAGPGVFGGISTPGTITHTPKGFPHRGPVENVPEGFRGLLIETRAALTPTAAGLTIAKAMETDQFAIHPSQAQRV